MTRKRWAVDSRAHGARSVYVDSEDAAKEYVKALKNGETPIRVFTRRHSIGGAKITQAKATAIRSEFAAGTPRYKIALMVGISPSAVGRFLAGRTWSVAPIPSGQPRSHSDGRQTLEHQESHHDSAL